MKMMKVENSSNVASLGYDELSNELMVEFKGKKGNKKYVYQNVPQKIWDEFYHNAQGKSIGGMVHNLIIKEGYKYKKIYIKKYS